MSTYTKAKADLERAMRAAGRLEREAIASNRVRPAAITVMQPYAWLIAHAPLWPTGRPLWMAVAWAAVVDGNWEVSLAT